MATTFSLFSQLPTELRCQIWKEAMPGSRVIEVSYYNKFACNTYPPNRPKPENTLFYGSSVKPPKLLQVCQDSRIEMQKKYKLVFQSACSPNPIYFNFEIDILLFSDRRHDTDIFWKYVRNPYEPFKEFINTCFFEDLIPRLHFPEVKGRPVLENLYMHCFLQSTRPEEVTQIRRVAHTIRKSESIFNSNCTALHLFSGLREYIMVFPMQDKSPIGQRGVGSTLNFTFREASRQLISVLMGPERRIANEVMVYEHITLARQLFSRLKNLDWDALNKYHGKLAANRVKEECLLNDEEFHQRQMGMVIVPNQPGWWASWNIPEPIAGFVLIDSSV